MHKPNSRRYRKIEREKEIYNYYKKKKNSGKAGQWQIKAVKQWQSGTYKSI